MELALIPIKDLIKTGWEIYQKNLKMFIIPILLLLPFHLVITLNLPIFDFLTDYFSFKIASLIDMIAIVFCIILYILSIYSTAKIAEAIYKKKKTDLTTVLNQGTKNILPIIWIAILIILIIMAGFLCLIIPAIFFAVWFFFAPIVKIIEEDNNSGLAALKQSYKLVKGRAWDVYGRIFIPSLCFVVINYIISVITFIVLLQSKMNVFSALTISTSTFSILMILVSPLYIIFNVILYYNLKETRKNA